MIGMLLHINSRSIAHKRAVVAVFLLVLVCAGVQPLAAQVYDYKDANGLWYSCNEATMEAVVISCQDKTAGYIYQQSAILIPATVAVSSGSIGGGGGSETEKVFAVTEIGENALKDSWTFSIAFADNSNVRVIRKRGIYNVISVSGTLTLPASLRVIEEEGLYVKSSAKAKDFISTLVLPAGLDSLGKSAIVLNKLQTLQFLGTTPPKCHYTESSNPWTAEDNATPDNITVTYPEGAYAAYNNCYGIGNYFTSFTGPETPTGMEEMQDADGYAGNEGGAIKVLLGGRVLILRDGRFYTMLGAPVEL